MEDICKKCGQPKKASSSGRLTQWVNVCICDVVQEGQEISVQLCANCGKRINEGRKGSITQFVFRMDSCRCDKPKPLERKGDFYHKEHVFEGYLDDGEDEEELPVEKDSFPTDRYKPVKKLGKGATGEVYQARDRLLGKKVAVKTLSYLESEQMIAFQKEAKATSLLNHPNIVKILDFGITEASTPFMVLEYIPGTSLEEILYTKNTLDWQTAIDVFKQVTEALIYSHREGIMHRDLKPSNILIDYDKDSKMNAKLIDFGIAHVQHLAQDEFDSQGKTLVGTPHYMSPDQAQGKPYTAESEVYTIGCVLFECLTGSPPYTAETPLELIRKHAQDDIPKLSERVGKQLPPILELILNKCLQKNPENRYHSIEELNEVLNSIEVVKEEAPDVETSDEVKTGPRVSKKTIIQLCTALLVAAGLITGYSYYFHHKVDVPEEVLKNSPTQQKLKERETEKGLEQILEGPHLSRKNTLLLYQYGDVLLKDLKPLDLSNVEIVEFDYCWLEGPGVFTELGKIPKLTRLLLPEGRGLTNESIQAFTDSFKANHSGNQLTTIDFTRTDIKPGCLKNLAGLKGISLNISKTSLTDEDMKDVVNIGPRVLSIDETTISNKSLNYLTNVKTLRMLTLANSKVTTRGVEKFKKAMPGCQITSLRRLRSDRL